jgi:hypothetical protein
MTISTGSILHLKRDSISHMKGGHVGCRNGLDTGQEVWRTVEMVWTQNGRLAGL